MQDEGAVVTAVCWAQLNRTFWRCLQGRKTRAGFLCGWEQPPRDLAEEHSAGCVPAGARATCLWKAVVCVNIRQRWSKGFRAVPCEKASSLMHTSSCPGLLVSLVLWKFSFLLYEIVDSPHVKMIFRVRTLPLDWVIPTVCFCSGRTRLRMACPLLCTSRAVGKCSETFLWYKFSLGAYGTNNHKLLGSILHLWLYFLCSQRAEDSL